MVVINFPKRLKYSKINPLEDFYSKCLKNLQKYSTIKEVTSLELLNIQVWAFSVNGQDYKRLRDLVRKHVKKQYPDLPIKKLFFNTELIMLDIGPRVDNSIKSGEVKVNLENLYENRNFKD